MEQQKAKEDPVVERFERDLERSVRRLIGPARPGWLLAVSGGCDSMALLGGLGRVRPRLGLRLEVAAVDHRLRAAAADEVAQVGRAAEALGLPFHPLVAAVAPGPGLEAAARAARYQALSALRVARGLDEVATAHTASDQAETLLMRLARGAALGGAAGVRARRGDGVVRPLLFATRADTEAYARARGLPCARDPMNEDPAFLRVRVRREVLPALEAAAGPAASRALARFAALAAEDDAYLHEQAARAWARVRWPDGSLEAGAVRALERPLRRRVLARLIEEAHLPVDAALVDDALEALDEGRVQTLPGDCLLDGGADRLIVTAAPPRALHPSSRSAPGRGAG